MDVFFLLLHRDFGDHVGSGPKAVIGCPSLSHPAKSAQGTMETKLNDSNCSSYSIVQVNEEKQIAAFVIVYFS
jgi:hypothetical protein